MKPAAAVTLSASLAAAFFFIQNSQIHASVANYQPLRVAIFGGVAYAIYLLCIIAFVLYYKWRQELILSAYTSVFGGAACLLSWVLLAIFPLVRHFDGLSSIESCLTGLGYAAITPFSLCAIVMVIYGKYALRQNRIQVIEAVTITRAESSFEKMAKRP